MKMRGVFLLALLVFATVMLTASAQSPVDLVDEKDDENAARPIRATPRKRVRSRGNGGRGVQKRTNRVQPAFRPTRAPLFEASPPDPYLDGTIESNSQQQQDIQDNHHGYGHSHAPPTADPYYSPIKFQREKKKKRFKSQAPRVLQNSFDVGSGSSEQYHQDTGAYNNNNVPEKNYAFAYAVGDDAEDFSHKQAKDGQVTIGEYRITLPDGRTQVVRYTAGGKTGYKADVTYEKATHPVQSLPNPSASPTLGGYRNHPSLNAGPHKQYLQSVEPVYHTPPSVTPSSSPSYNSNRIYKSRPLKTTPLYGEDDDEEDSTLGYNQPSSGGRGGSPRITFKGGSSGPRTPTPPTPQVQIDHYNDIGTTPTPRPNSIYDKISPYRGGNQYQSDDLAYAHEHSPRAGPARAKTRNSAVASLPPPPQPKVSTTAATYYGSSKYLGHPSLKSTVLPTKKYKDPYYQPQANHVKEYVRPKQHIQYLQETPIHHTHSPSPPSVLQTKPVKEYNPHVVSLNGPIRNHYVKPRKLKKKPAIHQSHGQYLVQNPAVSSQAPVSYHSTSAGLPKEPFHYYNSFHEPHHHGFGQISPTPTIDSNSLSNYSPSPSPYPVTAYAGPTRPYHSEQVTPTQPRIRLPVPPSTSGHVYLETPAIGARPSNMGVKEALARLPNLPSPQTTVHPYEIGAPDFGKGVSYGNAPQDKEFEQEHEQPYQFERDNRHRDHTSSLFSAVGNDEDPGFYQNDQFNFLESFNNFDIEQANVRQIRQPRQRRRRQRRPDKRRGALATTLATEPESPKLPPTPEVIRSPPPPPPTGRRRQPTTSRGKVKRRRMRPQEEPDPMMHAVETRRSRPRSRESSVSRQ